MLCPILHILGKKTDNKHFFSLTLSIRGDYVECWRRLEDWKGKRHTKSGVLLFLMYVCMCNYVCIIYLSIVYVFFWGSVSCLKGWPWTWFAAEDDLELMILPFPPECHGYRHVPAHPVCMVLGINPGFVCAGWALHQMNSILSCGFQVTSKATLDSCIWVNLEGSEDTCHREHKISSLQNWAGLAAGGLGICDCSCTHMSGFSTFGLCVLASSWWQGVW